MSDNQVTPEIASESLNTILDQFVIINNSLTLFKMQISTLQQHVKTVEKNVKKELKTVTKNSPKDKPKSTRLPSGFAKPTKVTKELCDFMGKPEGTEIARTEVTKTLVNYIKNNNLLNQSECLKNKIIPDDKLKALLKIQENELNDLTYFNMQKYMNQHFYSNKFANLIA